MPTDQHHHAIQHGAADPDLIELLDLEGEVLHSYWSSVISWLQDAIGDLPSQRLVDLGAGTGTGALALAQRFAEADVIAVDASPQMLQRTHAKSLSLGLDRRVRTVHADLDAGWPPSLDGIDLTWASMSLHHFADPDRVLREVCAATRPGGLIAVAELGDPVRFLPDDVGVGRPGLETRCLDAMASAAAEDLPHLGSQWSPRIEAAGFTVLAERTFTLDVDPPHAPGAARLAHLWLNRVRSGLADRLAPDDLDALAVLLDGGGPESISRRDDLRIRGTRVVSLGRREAKSG